MSSAPLDWDTLNADADAEDNWYAEAITVPPDQAPWFAVAKFSEQRKLPPMKAGPAEPAPPNLAGEETQAADSDDMYDEPVVSATPNANLVNATPTVIVPETDGYDSNATHLSPDSDFDDDAPPPSTPPRASSPSPPTPMRYANCWPPWTTGDDWAKTVYF